MISLARPANKIPSRWLALWAAYSMTDSWVRYQAIELALEKQLRR